MNERQYNPTRFASRARLARALAPLAMGLAAGCTSVGPSNIQPDSFNYNERIAAASNEQMLLNLVRLRYNEPPSFLTVSSVLTQYVYSGNVSVTGSVGESVGDSAWSVGAGGGYRYIERPTISYSPLRGEEFAEHMLQPVPTSMAFSLIASGWPPEQLLLMCVFRINELVNVSLATDEGEAAANFVAFRRVIDQIVALSRRSLVEVIQRDEKNLMVFATEVEEDENRQLIADFKAALGLDPALNEIAIVHRHINRRPGEMTVRSRSLLEMMGFLAHGVSAAPDHVAAGEVGRDWDDATALVPFEVQTSKEPPERPFVSIRFRDRHFFIPESDQGSKRAFGILTYLFQLQAPRAGQGAPILTVPAG